MLFPQQQGSAHKDIEDLDETNPLEIVEDVLHFKYVSRTIHTMKKFFKQRPNDTILSVRILEQWIRK